MMSLRLLPGSIIILTALPLLCLPLQGCGFFASAPPPVPAAMHKHKILCSAWGQMGKKYKAGAASPQKGFDCSGLVWWSYKQNGVNIPRITADQAKTGKKITRSAAKPGDIVVFRTGDSPRGLHTGIYAGNGKFIHSPSSGKTVCLEELGSHYWKNRLLAFRRVER